MGKMESFLLRLTRYLTSSLDGMVMLFSATGGVTVGLHVKVRSIDLHSSKVSVDINISASC